MPALIRSAVFSIALLFGFGLGLAGAQQGNLASPEQKATQEEAQHAEPTGVTEPSSMSEAAKAQPTPVLVNGRLSAPGAPVDSQTVPSTQSARNAAMDALPSIMALSVRLTDAQKQSIREALKNSSVPIVEARLALATELPFAVRPGELPDRIRADIPAAHDLSVVRTRDKILLVTPASRTVVAEIPN